MRSRSPLPDGLPSWAVSVEDEGVRLGRFLAASSRLTSHGRAAAALERGKVFVNGAEAAPADAGSVLRAGDVVTVWTDRPGSRQRRTGGTSDGGVSILYEDAAIVVVNKPSGLLSVPLGARRSAPSVFGLLEARLRPAGKRRPLVVHRIDRDTSGLVIFAKSVAAQVELKDQFARREPERVYRAIVHGHPSPEAGMWRDHLVWDRRDLAQKQTDAGDPSGKEAVSAYRVLERLHGASLIEVRLETGKRNQIRVQAQLRGHPLFGERQYVFGAAPGQAVPFPRQALHAHRLAFRHPVDGRPLQFEAPLPPDLEQLLETLRRTAR